jgi:hypothetical protein
MHIECSKRDRQAEIVVNTADFSAFRSPGRQSGPIVKAGLNLVVPHRTFPEGFDRTSSTLIHQHAPIHLPFLHLPPPMTLPRTALNPE